MQYRLYAIACMRFSNPAWQNSQLKVVSFCFIGKPPVDLTIFFLSNAKVQAVMDYYTKYNRKWLALEKFYR
jgi:hypothetical protein